MKKAVLAAGLLSLMLPLNVYAELTAEDVQKIDANYSLAVNYINKGDYEKAEKYLDSCLQYDQDDMNDEFLADLLLKKGCMQTINGDNEGALENLDRAISLKSDLADAYLIKAQINIDDQQYDVAVEAMEQYINLTDDAEMYEKLAELYQQTGDIDKADENYKAYLDNSGNTEIEAAYKNALFLMNNGRYDEAIEEFAKCTEDEALGATAKYNQSVCKMNQGKYEEAEAEFREMLDAEDPFDGIHYNLGICAMMTENYETAFEEYQKSIESESFANEARRNTALCYIDQENYTDALTELQTLIDEETELADEARYFRVSVELLQEDKEAALEDLSVCIEHEYELAQCYYMRAQIYQEQGEEDLYIADLEAYLNS